MEEKNNLKTLFMKSICFIVPYMGKLPNNFQLWLLGCKKNPTINWIVITDDHTQYDYPCNVVVEYMTYENLKNIIQSLYDFQIDLSRPWRLALLKPAYGEIFQKLLNGYDFWGYCDVDMMFGNLRKYLTEDLLGKYKRLGCIGYMQLYKNDKNVNTRYRVLVPHKQSYVDVFSGKSDSSFDEKGMDAIYDYLNIPYYQSWKKSAHLAKYNSGFFSTLDAKIDQKFLLYTWEKGVLHKHLINDDGYVKEELMYVHFWCRPMKYKVHNFSEDTKIWFYPDVATDTIKKQTSMERTIKHYGHRSKLSFLINMLWVNRHKINAKRIIANLKFLLLFNKRIKKQHSIFFVNIKEEFNPIVQAFRNSADWKLSKAISSEVLFIYGKDFQVRNFFTFCWITLLKSLRKDVIWMTTNEDKNLLDGNLMNNDLCFTKKMLSLSSAIIASSSNEKEILHSINNDESVRVYSIDNQKIVGGGLPNLVKNIIMRNV